MSARDTLTGWPHSDHSRFVESRPHRWHVQEMGRGDTVLCLHGASGATHSWRDVMSNLAADHHVVAIDLPGHGHTRLGSRHRSSLPLMTQDIRALIQHENWAPKAILAHSAGAAIGLRLLQDTGGQIPLIGINPALTPFKGLAGLFFPMAARLVTLNPVIAKMIKRKISEPGQIVSLMGKTGSRLSSEGLNLYARLFRDEAHLDGTLLMMSKWMLDGLVADLEHIHVPCTFLVGENDKTVAPDTVQRIAQIMPNAEVLKYPGYGHLLHEEAPELVANHLREVLRK